MASTAAAATVAAAAAYPDDTEVPLAHIAPLDLPNRRLGEEALAAGPGRSAAVVEVQRTAGWASERSWSSAAWEAGTDAVADWACSPRCWAPCKAGDIPGAAQQDDEPAGSAAGSGAGWRSEQEPPPSTSG